MAKSKLIVFTVEGAGRFPIDMLRYDACYPTDSGSVDGINFSLAARKVTLRAASNFITPARWASFGWRVTKVEVNHREVPVSKWPVV